MVLLCLNLIHKYMQTRPQAQYSWNFEWNVIPLESFYRAAYFRRYCTRHTANSSLQQRNNNMYA